MASFPVARNRQPRAAWGCALIIAATLLAYWPSLHNGFVWDDDTFLTGNPLIQAPDGLHRFWLTTQPDDYWPVTSTTLWAEWRLWGAQAAGYHVTNLVLHLAEALLLWRILQALQVPGALLGALLFAVHPVNVESVAWIAQRKNLMAMLFFLGSIYSFLKTGLMEPPPPGRSGAPKEGGFGTSGARWYGLSLAAFVLAMLSKGSVAPLPVVLAGFIAWRRRFTPKDGLRLAPFFAVAVALTAVNIWYQTHGLPEVARSAGSVERLLGAGAVVWFYLWKAIFPVHLIFNYPRWQIVPGDWRWWLPLLAALAFTVFLWRRSRPLFFAWAYFAVMLIPAMGFTDVGYMQYSLVADHYQHLALIGLTAAAGAGLALIPSGAAGRAVSFTVAGLLAILSYRQCTSYRDSGTLYQATLRRNPGSWLATNNLGNLMLDQGRTQEAMAYFERTLRIKPDYAEAENNLGTALSRLGRLPEALAHYDAALRIKPDYAGAEYNLGTTLMRMGQTGGGAAHFQRALQIRPGYPEAHNNLGAALAALGRRSEAIAHYEMALRLRPDFAEADYNLGLALREAGDRRAALDRFSAAVRLKSDYGDALNALGLALYDSGRIEEAVPWYEHALQLNPDDPQALNNLGVALLKLGRVDEALARLQQARRLKLDLPDLPYNLGVALARTGRLAESIDQFQEAVRLNPGNADARLKLAAVLWQAGRQEEAVSQRQEAARLVSPPGP